MPELAPIHRLPQAYRTLILSTTSTPLPSSARRSYATSTSVGTTTPPPTSRHRRVTVFNDQGTVPWGDLSPMEKAARTTQQSFNFGLIAAGAVATVAVFTFMYTDVFSSQSSTSHFNRAVDRIRSDPQVVEVLGKGSEIRAFGEPTWNKWRRNRPIASRTETDKMGTERLWMHFNVAGPEAEGVAHLHMIRRQGENTFHYAHLVVDVIGHPRITLESGKENERKKRTPGTFLGIRWT